MAKRAEKNIRTMSKLSTKNLIIITIITTIIVTALTLSKYKATVADSDNTRIAIPVMYFDTTTRTILLEPKNPVDNEQTCYFSVNNSKDDGITSEVTMEYTLQIKSLGNLPLDFELYTYDETETDETKKVCTTNLLSGNGTITEYIQMPYNANYTHTYQLKIKWRDGQTSYEYSQVADYVQIVLNSRQVD